MTGESPKIRHKVRTLAPNAHWCMQSLRLSLEKPKKSWKSLCWLGIVLIAIIVITSFK